MAAMQFNKVEFNAQIISNQIMMEANRQKREWAMSRQPKQPAVTPKPVTVRSADLRELELSQQYPTRKFDDLSKKQVEAARKFAAKYHTTVSQASKYIEACFAHQREEISDSDLKILTGWTF